MLKAIDIVLYVLFWILILSFLGGLVYELTRPLSDYRPIMNYMPPDE